MGHRRDHRGLRSRKGLLALGALVVLLAAFLGGAKLWFAARRAEVEGRWEASERDAVLDRALVGVRRAFRDMAEETRRTAETVADEIVRAGAPSEPEGPDRDRLFDAVFRTAAPEGLDGVLLIDDRGRELAWHGRVQSPGEEIVAAAGAGAPWIGVLRSELHRTIAAAVPFRSDAGLRGAVVAFRPFDVTYPLHNRYLPGIRVEEDLARLWSVARVRVTTPIEARPYESRLGGVLTASLELEKGQVVAAVEIQSETRDGYLAMAERREAAWTAGLGAALAATVGALLLVLLFRIRRGPEALRALGAVAVLAAFRIALQRVGFPEATGPDALLDPADFATTHLGGLLGNPGELLLTALVAAGAAALVIRQAVCALGSAEADRHWPVPVVAGVGVAGLIVTAWLASQYRFLVRSLVFDSTLDYVSPQSIWPDGPLLLMVVSLFLLTAALLLVSAAALLPAARALRRLGAAARLWPWPAIAAALWLGLRLFETEGPGWSLVAMSLLLVACGWLIESGRVRKFPSFLGLTAIPGTLLAFVFLGPTVAAEVRSDLRSEVRQIVRSSIRGPEFAVDRFLRRAERNPALRRALGGSFREEAGLAFRLWAGSGLSARGIDCDVEVRDAEGRRVSHWEIRMPPASWLPRPRPGGMVTRARTDRIEGEGGAEGQIFLVGSGPVLGEGDELLGTVLVRVPTHGDVRGREPPEILRNVDSAESGADRRSESLSWYRGNRLVDSTDPHMPRARRAPPSVVEALLEGDDDEVWVRETRNGDRVLDLYVPWTPPDDPEAEPGLLAASLRRPGVLELLRFFLKLLLVGSLTALLLYAGHLLLRLRRLQFRFQHKLLLSYLILSALPVALLARVNTDLAEARFRESLEDRLRESLGAITRALAPPGDVGLEARLPDLLDEQSGIAPVASEWCKEESWRLNRDINVYVVSRLRASSEPGVFRTELFPDRLSGRAFLEVVLRRREFFAYRERAGDYSFLTGYAPLHDPGSGEVIGAIGVPMFWRQGALDRDLARRNATLLATYLLTLILVVFIGIFLSRRISSPIERLAEATHRLGGGDLSYRIPRGSKDEFGDLVDSFNRMAEDLQLSRERIVRAEKEAAWREMALQVAHEIKNPLTPMKLAAQQILRAWEDRHPDLERILKRAGETIVRQVENLRRIATDFGDFARVSVPDAQPISVDDVVRDACALYAGQTERGIRLETDLEDGLPLVRADAADLKRVLINLLQNAVQALEHQGGGTISVSTSPTTVRFEGAEHPFVEITVADDGPGIPPALRERVFEPNFSTKSGGTGLGLAICRQIVESLRGQIRVESDDGHGATVRIHLPALQA